MNEIWRFFVERNRYDMRMYLYASLFRMYDPENIANNSTADLISLRQYYIDNNLTVGALREKVYRDKITIGRDALPYILSNTEDSQSVVSAIDRNVGWIGFEAGEKYYLRGVTNGFIYILSELSCPRKPLTQQFINGLNYVATCHVDNMLSDHLPGVMRDHGSCWGFTKQFDTKDGMRESIEYINSLSSDCIHYELLEDRCSSKPIKSKTIEDVTSVFDLIYTQEISIYHHAVSNSKTKPMLSHLCESLINTYNQDIDKAVTKDEKLNVIFTFLKRTVLHHPYQDGVGRTYSMLLIQYLLMRENLLPVLLPNSNIIPGHSVAEMKALYLKCEKEMELILADSSYVSSREFYHANISTGELARMATDEDRAYFFMCVEKVKQAVGNYCMIKSANQHFTKHEHHVKRRHAHH
jgi:hypothetical protein